MENRLATVSTIVRMGPLLGLLGTVASMIGAFSQIGSSEQVNPRALASQISLALWATGAGLLIANPMMLIGNDVHARLRRLRDRTERQLQEVLEVLEPLESQQPAQVPRGARHRVGLSPCDLAAMTTARRTDASSRTDLLLKTDSLSVARPADRHAAPP